MICMIFVFQIFDDSSFYSKLVEENGVSAINWKQKMGFSNSNKCNKSSRCPIMVIRETVRKKVYLVLPENQYQVDFFSYSFTNHLPLYFSPVNCRQICWFHWSICYAQTRHFIIRYFTQHLIDRYKRCLRFLRFFPSILS